MEIPDATWNKAIGTHLEYKEDFYFPPLSFRWKKNPKQVKPKQTSCEQYLTL